MDLVAAKSHPHSPISSALSQVSPELERPNAQPTHHRPHAGNVSRVGVPIFLIVDFIAAVYPTLLLSCALISHNWYSHSEWYLYRLKRRFYRHMELTTRRGLLEIFDIASLKENASVCQWTTSLEVCPYPGMSSSYIPFLLQSSRVLPNVSRLVWGETVQWTDYPPLYNNGAVGSSFHAVVALDIHCPFLSARALFRAVRSFKNLEQVPLLRPHPFPTHAAPNLSTRASSEIKLQKPLRLLEIPLSVLPATLDLCGNYIVNLTIRCPPASALSSIQAQVPVGTERHAFSSSLRSLETVNITMPVTDSELINNATSLQNLRRLVVAPIHKVGVRFSLFLMRCSEHSVVGYCVEDISRAAMLEALRTLATKTNAPLTPPCQACAKRSATLSSSLEEFY